MSLTIPHGTAPWPTCRTSTRDQLDAITRAALGRANALVREQRKIYDANTKHAMGQASLLSEESV